MSLGTIDTQEVITFPPVSSGIVGSNLTYRILVDEPDASVRVLLQWQSNSSGWVLARQDIPFADPKCIQKVVKAIEDKALEQQFIDEYASGHTLAQALKKWVDEKGLRRHGRFGTTTSP